MSLPSAVVFDLDDTLHDTRAIEQAMLVELAAAVRAELPTAVEEELIARFRDGRDALYEKLLHGEWDLDTYRREHMLLTLEPWGEPSEALIARTVELRGAQLQEARFVEHALELLAALRAEGVRTTLLTNGPSQMQRRKVELLGLEEHIDAIGISEELGHAKPAPQAYLGALALIDADAGEAMMVGDHLAWDVQGALDAGLRGAVWMSREPQDTRAAPAGAVRVGHLREVPA
ncbi:MAG: HAD family hydrolase, partial [Actinomycetota bacterium]|nr:HAD family hydrolase [Actinomycetota bacterium]